MIKEIEAEIIKKYNNEVEDANMTSICLNGMDVAHERNWSISSCNFGGGAEDWKALSRISSEIFHKRRNNEN